MGTLLAMAIEFETTSSGPPLSDCSMHCRRPGNLSLDGQTEGEDLRSVDDEYCHSHSEYLRRAANASEKQSSDRALLQEFLNFVRREDPKALSTIEALLATGTQADAADWRGGPKNEIFRVRTPKGPFAPGFLNGGTLPRQRKT